MKDDIQPLIVTTTSDDRAELHQIAKLLVKRRLAACCQIGGPVTSHYQWDGQIESSEEWVCVIKTTRNHFPAVTQAIEDLHHYEIPQIISIRIDSGSPDYLAWFQQQIS